ncbi:MAG: preprotein translocase subunit YajC [Hymenobacter sp.]
MQLVFPVAIGLVLYFFMIRPQQRKTADAKSFRESLVKGTRVVTIGGMHGLLVEVGPETVLLEVERGQRLRFDRSAVARVAGSATTADSPAAANARSDAARAAPGRQRPRPIGAGAAPRCRARWPNKEPSFYRVVAACFLIASTLWMLRAR